MDKIEDPIGIEYGDETLTVKNVFETERMKNTLKTMRKYYKAGYINMQQRHQMIKHRSVL